MSPQEHIYGILLAQGVYINKEHLKACLSVASCQGKLDELERHDIDDGMGFNRNSYTKALDHANSKLNAAFIRKTQHDSSIDWFVREFLSDRQTP